jgi:hypothetical protein
VVAVHRFVFCLLAIIQDFRQRSRNDWNDSNRYPLAKWRAWPIRERKILGGFRTMIDFRQDFNQKETFPQP